MEQVEEFARGVDAPTPLLELALRLYGEARAAGHGADDVAVMVEHLAGGPRDLTSPEAVRPIRGKAARQDLLCTTLARGMRSRSSSA